MMDTSSNVLDMLRLYKVQDLIAYYCWFLTKVTLLRLDTEMRARLH